jgi:hypothetical protein
MIKVMDNIRMKKLMKNLKKMNPALLMRMTKKDPCQKPHKKGFKRIILKVILLEIKMEEWKQEGNSDLNQNKQCYP